MLSPFTFRPKHEAEARSIIAGLIPFLRDEGFSYFLHMFSAKSQQRHALSQWNAETRQVSSIEEEELAEFLAEDNDLNLSDEPTQEKTERMTGVGHRLQSDRVQFDIPDFTPTNFPDMNNDADFVLTFHPSAPNAATRANLEKGMASEVNNDSVSKLSDTASNWIELR
jgi:hypothetical protein